MCCCARRRQPTKPHTNQSSGDLTIVDLGAMTPASRCRSRQAAGIAVTPDGAGLCDKSEAFRLGHRRNRAARGQAIAVGGSLSRRGFAGWAPPLCRRHEWAELLEISPRRENPPRRDRSHALGRRRDAGRAFDHRGGRDDNASSHRGRDFARVATIAVAGTLWRDHRRARRTPTRQCRIGRCEHHRSRRAQAYRHGPVGSHPMASLGQGPRLRRQSIPETSACSTRRPSRAGDDQVVNIRSVALAATARRSM